MKRLNLTLAALLLTGASMMTSCQKEDYTSAVNDSQEVILSIKDGSIEAEVSTKITAVSSIPSTLNFSMTTGSNSSQVQKCAPVNKTVSSNQISTGYYQTYTPTTYVYYLSNVAMSFSASGNTVFADGTTTDVIAGKATSSSTAPSVTMNHIFARTGSLSCISSNSYSISDVTYKLKSKDNTTGRKGTYNIYSGSWSGTTKLDETVIDSSSDLYLVPGVYTLTVSGTETFGDYSDTFSGTVDITLVAGKINNISVSRASDGASQIVVTTSLASWGTNNIKPSI